MKYRPEIDGLRAIAVIPVILFHAGFATFSGGYVGVDVFFVISGYLITTILISEREAGTYSLSGFYERRARRILPALFVMLIVTIPFAWQWLSPALFKDYARSQAFAAMFISNIHFLEKSSYYDVGSALRPLLHTWSLAVEEQYYLLFPLVLLPLGLFVRRKFLGVFLVISAVSLAVAEWGWRNYPGENFYFTFSRLWELLAGSICAAILFGRPQMRSDIAAFAGLALIGFSVFAYSSAVPFPSLYTLVPVVGTALIILFADRGTWTARLLSVRLMVWIGLLSYSAYLWHQPLFAFARIRSIAEPSMWLMSALALLSIGLAYLTLRFVETPFRTRRILPGRNSLLATSGIGIVLIAAFGIAGEQTDGFPGRIDRTQPGLMADLSEQISASPGQNGCLDGPGLAAERLCTIYAADSPTAKVAVLGDSHATALLPGFARLAEVYHVDVDAAARGACPPLLGVYLAKGGQEARKCFDLVQKSAQDVVDRGVETVYLVARWSLYATGEYGDDKATYALSTTYGTRHVGHAERVANYRNALDATLAYYSQAGIRVILVGQVPLQWQIAQNMIEQAALMGLTPQESREKFRLSFVTRAANDALFKEADDILLDLAARYDADVLTLADAFADGDHYRWFRSTDDVTLYRDSNHLSVAGALSLAPLLVRSYPAR